MTAEAYMEVLKSTGVGLVSGLPDNWLGPLSGCLQDDPDIDHVPVAREVEALGVCAGAWLGGTRPVALMGLAGVLTCGHEFATLNLAHQVPVLVLSTMRGTIADLRTYQVAQGLVGTSYLDGLGIPYLVMDHVPEPDEFSRIYERTLLVKRPLVLLNTKDVLAREAVAR